MSTDCALNIIPTGDYEDNSVLPQKSICTISNSCDNRTPSTWYINETDDSTQVTIVAPISADVALQTINENGDFTEVQNKMCIHDLSKNINGHLPTPDECDETENFLTKILRKTRYNSYEEEFQPFCAEIYNNDVNAKMFKNTRKSASFDNFGNYDKTLQTISINISDKRNEKINKNIYKHVPHKDRPPLIVARRNARERRRVQAVNSAFMRLRKFVPLGNNRGKRISKVKILQTAIDYIGSLQSLLKQTDMYDLNIISTCPYYRLDNFEDEY